MKVNELTPKLVKQYARIRVDEDDVFISEVIMPAALGYLESYTGMSEEDINKHEELTLAYLALCVHYYDCRGVLAPDDKVNRVIDSTINMHSSNLV